MKFISITNNKNLLVLIVLIPFLLIRFKYLNFVPFWDGSLYFEGLLKAIKLNKSSGFSLENFNLYNHLSMFYLFYLSLGQLLDYGNHIILNLQITIISIISLYYFYEILNFYFPKHKFENALCTLLLSINPLFISTSINLNIDFPILLFLISFYYGFIYHKNVVLLISSFFLIFTNFSGIFLFVVSFLFILIYFIINKTEIKIKLRRTLLILIIPMCTLCVYYLQKFFILGAFWSRGWVDSNKNTLNSFVFNYNLVKARFIQIFILNFQWIATLFIIAFAIHFLFMKQNKKQSSLTKRNVYLLFMIFQFLLLLFVLFKYQTFTNPRYIIPSIFFTTFFFYYSVMRLFVKYHKIRISILIIMIILFTIQNFTSTDPISKLLYGSFKFGNNSLYKMTSITKEGMGLGGRDQLVYNAQYTIINSLVNKLYLRLNALGNDFLIVHNKDGNFFLFTKYDIDTKERTPRNENYIIPNVCTISDINLIISNGEIPDNSRIYYVNLPWITDKEEDINELKKNFNISNELFIEEDGYKLSYFKLSLN